MHKLNKLHIILLLIIISILDRTIHAEELELLNYTTTAHKLNLKYVVDFDFDHIALLSEKGNEAEFIAIIGNQGNFLDKKPLYIYKIKINLKEALITENKLLLKIDNNLRSTDVLITKKKRIFISYLSPYNDNKQSLKVIELIITKDKIQVKEIFSTKNFNTLNANSVIQSGGKMTEFLNNKILLAVGDFAYWEYNDSEFLYLKSDDLGKTFLINPDTGKFKRFTEGHRNPQGLVVSSEGKILLTEHGPEGGDEINLLNKGKNYGWPYETYGQKYYSDPDEFYKLSYGTHTKYTKPVFAFIPSIGIKAIEQFPTKQTEFPKWKNNFLICSAHGIYRAEINLKKSSLILLEKLEDKKTLNPKLKKTMLCRDINILSNGLFITNHGRLYFRNK